MPSAAPACSGTLFSPAPDSSLYLLPSDLWVTLSQPPWGWEPGLLLEQAHTHMVMNTWQEYFGHCNSDHGSKAGIAAPAQGSLLPGCAALTCSRAGYGEVKQSTTRLHACVWWFVHSERERQFPQWWHWPQTFLTGKTGKIILGKLLGCNSESGASIPSNKLSLWTFRENILKTCSAPDQWDAPCSLFSLQNVLQKLKKRRTQHYQLISTSYTCYCWFQIKYKETAISYWVTNFTGPPALWHFMNMAMQYCL